jgi:hypothetical protein
MPVYIRKSQAIEASENSCDENDDNHNDKFMTDPDVWKDTLPQPYR